MRVWDRRGAHRQEEGDKKAVVAPANGVPHPGAVVVELVDAGARVGAVVAALLNVHEARAAVLQDLARHGADAPVGHASLPGFLILPLLRRAAPACDGLRPRGEGLARLGTRDERRGVCVLAGKAANSVLGHGGWGAAISVRRVHLVPPPRPSAHPAPVVLVRHLLAERARLLWGVQHGERARHQR